MESRSKNSCFASRIVILLFACAACSSSKAAVAVLDKASAPVQRHAAGEAHAAPVGTKFYLDDIVRTTTGTAELALTTGGRIEMPPNTALRFVARVGLTAMVIENGTITLSGTGNYRLELGTLSLVNGTVRIGGGKTPTVELVFGRGELDRDGQRTPLEANKVLEFGTGMLAANVDAGVADTPIQAPSSDDMTIEVSGDGATMQAPGDTKWGKLGSGSVAPGARIALDAKTTAKLTIRGTTLDLAPGTRALVTSSREIHIEAGAATAHVGIDGGQIGVPGGQVKLSANGTAIIDVGARGDAKVTAVTEGVQLIGKRGSVDVRQGELALVHKAGGVAPGELVIPAHYDYELRVGEPANITLHDPAGVTAVRFAFATPCSKGGAIELARSSQFRSPLISVGDSAAHLMVRSGRWAYRARCNGDTVASGHIIVLRDRGTRRLPKDPPRFEIAADGRNYRLDYQTHIPDVQLRAGGRGTTFKLHLTSGKDERVFSSTTGSFKVPGTTLREREYTFWVERDGVKSKVSTLRIGFDQTTAQVYIETPVDGRAWGPYIEVAGATLPGWTATIDGKSIPADKDTRRFGTMMPAPKDARAVAIQLSHPERGVHVYLRRGARR